MKRRYFIGALPGAALTWPLQARAERAGNMARIGIVLTDPTNPITAQNNGALLAGLRDLDYSEGKNLDVFQMDVLSQSPAAFPSDLDLIVASGPEVTLRAALA